MNKRDGIRTETGILDRPQLHLVSEQPAHMPILHYLDLIGAVAQQVDHLSSVGCVVRVRIPTPSRYRSARRPRSWPPWTVLGRNASRL